MLNKPTGCCSDLFRDVHSSDRLIFDTKLQNIFGC
uniref:Uncharacterized protein n=1 Tax=Siphoviridae sp. ctcUB23 TaxID=2825573 RepID=A0A8S5PLL5_9CAUD|nr:MAG TPA: hypothetical protein [Siphoviridae sp. ctcUB23]